MRNDLLEQIVIASGGTVTNKDDRNSLLSDWLAAVSSPKVEVARLDGATQYWQLSSPIQLDLSGFVFEFDYIVTSQDAINGLFSNDKGLGGFSAYERVSSGRLATFYYETISGTLNSNLFGSVGSDTGLLTFRFEKVGNDLIVSVGNRAVTVSSSEFTDNFIMKYLGRVASLYALGYFKNFRVYNSLGVLTNEIPLTNKMQGATQLATVGNVNATMINYTGDEWEVEP